MPTMNTCQALRIAMLLSTVLHYYFAITKCYTFLALITKRLYDHFNSMRSTYKTEVNQNVYTTNIKPEKAKSNSKFVNRRVREFKKNTVQGVKWMNRSRDLNSAFLKNGAVKYLLYLGQHICCWQILLKEQWTLCFYLCTPQIARQLSIINAKITQHEVHQKSIS